MAKKKNRGIRSRRRSRRDKGGRRSPIRPDTRLRFLLILVVQGVREVTIRGSREASQIGKFWAAVQRYLQTGDDSALTKFRGRYVTDTSGNRYFFLTDLRQLDRLASAGVLSFESIYAGGGR